MPKFNFNPRTREGCDVSFNRVDFVTFGISIHAPVKGATPRLFAFAVVFNFISIHAPVKGATAFKLAQSLSALSSIILRTD